jgi:hypothetical protein
MFVQRSIFSQVISELLTDDYGIKLISLQFLPVDVVEIAQNNLCQYRLG